jgi:putative DNA primase/helicase
MQRKTWRENCERLRNLDGTDLRRKCARFVLDRVEEIGKAQPPFPEDLNDRASDIWEPLLAVADLAGGDWPNKARAAAVGLTASAQGESPIGSLLLDVMVAFAVGGSDQEKAGIAPPKEGGRRVFSRDIVAWLNSTTDRPWVAMRKGKEVTELWLAQMLRPYGIKPKTIWIGEQAAKGYAHDEFSEVFRRYVSKSAAAAYVEELGATRTKRDDKGDNKGQADSASTG